MADDGGEEFVVESVIADVAVRFIALVEGGYAAAGAPVADEWCYLADGESLEELEVAAQAILGDNASRGVFIRVAALLGVPWGDEMLPLLVAQEEAGRKLAATAPDTAEADPAELRKIREAAAADTSE